MSLKKVFSALLAFIGIFFASCYKENKTDVMKIGIDPSYIPYNMMGQETYITGYIQELLQKIGKESKQSIELIKLSWDDLLPQLKTNKLDGIITTISPYNFYKKDFAFSEPIISTGPCLVCKKNQEFKDLDDLDGKILGIISGSSAELIAGKIAQITIQSFESPSSLLDALTRGQIDAAMLEYLIAYAYTQDLYQKTLVITTSAFGDQGIRFMTKKTNEKAIKMLEDIDGVLKEGSIDALLKKWQLPPEM